MIPDDIVQDWLLILIMGDACGQDGRLPTVANSQAAMIRLKAILNRLMKKHLSDGEDPEDKKRLVIDILKTSLALAEGRPVTF